MNLELKGKVAIVGGASKGIGFGIARALAHEGAAVAITARREADLLAAAAALREETGATILPIAADCRKAADCQRVAATVLAELGGIDILVNNDGAPPLGDALSFDDTAWLKAVEQNLMYVVRMVREVVPAMRARGGGSILNITAISAIQPIAGFALSVSTWAGVIGYAKTLSLEVGKDGINVNTICPGYIDTTRLQKVFAAGSESADVVQARLKTEIPMGRIGTVDDIAHLVALLVSPKGGYITGTAIQVDGGLLRATR
jgi:3-oxoacyl-[acyl-carrier protein] reductase